MARKLRSPRNQHAVKRRTAMRGGGTEAHREGGGEANPPGDVEGDRELRKKRLQSGGDELVDDVRAAGSTR